MDLLTCNWTEVRRYLDAKRALEVADSDCCGCSDLLYFLQNVPDDELLATTDRRVIVHMIAFSVKDINAKTEAEETALHLVLRRFHGDVEICEPLLQLGADIHVPNKTDQSCSDLVKNCSSETRKLFERYSPGLWLAVQKDDITSVRRLINLWCSTDVHRNGKSLKELTLDKGTEHIITLITKIQPSMKLAHAVLARDYLTAKTICDSKPLPKVDFKNLGDMGATPLFYAISQNNTEMVQLLIKHGARIDSLITLEDEEIPVIFAALNSETDVDIIRCLIPSVDECPTLDALHYRGLNILMHCVQNEVNAAVVRHILQQGHSRIVAQRDQQNLCAADMAKSLERQDCAKIIDEAIHDWYLGSDGTHRKTLALHGYTGLHLAERDGVRARDVVQSMETSSQQAQFDMQLQHYQGQIIELASAVINGYLEQVKQLVYYKGADESCLYSCLINACPQGDGQSILHKAALHKQRAVLRFLCNTWVTRLHRKLDDVRDQWRRTPLHYAYAHDDNDQIVDVLLDAGASEFTLDTDGVSPHVMRDFRHRPEMKQFIKYHCIQDYSSPEPKPWKSPRPPIKLIMSASARHSHQHNSPHKPPVLPTSYSYWTSYCCIL